MSLQDTLLYPNLRPSLRLVSEVSPVVLPERRILIFEQIGGTSTLPPNRACSPEGGIAEILKALH